MYIMMFFAPIILFLFAIIISTGKANFLIAGYNTASKEEKSKIDEKALSKFMGKFLFVLGLIQLIIPIAKIAEISDFSALLACTNVIFLITVFAGVIYMNTANRFKK